jgi:hypothetical protein
LSTLEHWACLEKSIGFKLRYFDESFKCQEERGSKRRRQEEKLTIKKVFS